MKTTEDRIKEIMKDISDYFEPKEEYAVAVSLLEEKLKNRLEALVLSAKIDQLKEEK